MDFYNQTVKLKHEGRTESFNLGYGTDVGGNTEEDFTAESKTEDNIG